MSQSPSSSTPLPSERQRRSPPERRRKRTWRWLRRGAWLLGLIGLVVLAGEILVGKRIVLPEGVRTRVQERISTGVDGLEITFGGAALTVERGWRPRLALWDVDLNDTNGRSLIRVDSLRASVATQPLLSGKLSAENITLEGATLLLRRERDGSFNLAFGASSSNVGRAANLTALIEQLDGLLIDGALQNLEEIDASGLVVQYEDARAGRAWVVDGGSARLVRADGRLRLSSNLTLLSGRAYATALEANYESILGGPEAEFGINISDMASEDIATQAPSMAWMNILRAPISGALRGGVDSEGELAPLHATLQIGAGVVQPSPQARPVPFHGGQIYFTFDPVGGGLRFDQLSADSAMGRISGEGTAHLQGLEQGWPTEMVAQLRLTELRSEAKELIGLPLSFERADLDLRMGLNPFYLDIGRLDLFDGQSKAHLSGRLTTDSDGWRLALDSTLDKISVGRTLDYWPDNVAVPLRNWIVGNIPEGRLEDVELSLRKRGESKAVVHLAAAFRGARLRYLRELPEIEDLAGRFSLSGHRFSLTASAGKTVLPEGRLDVAGTSFIIPDTRVKGAPANVRLAVSGPIPAALALLDKPPLELLSKAGRSAKGLATGRAQVSGTLDIALKRKLSISEIGYDIAARLGDVSSSALVKGHKISARSLRLTATPETLEIAGAVNFSGVPAEGRWRMPMAKAQNGKSRVEARVTVSPAALAKLGIGLPDGMVSGKGSGQLTLDIARNQPVTYTFSSALSGIGLSVPQIGWSLGRKSKGKLIVTGALSRPVSVKSLKLDAGGLSLRGSVSLTSSGSLREARFSQVKLGGWFDAPVVLEGRGKGATPSLRIRGGRIDMRRLQASNANVGGAGGGGGGAPVSVRLDRLVVSEGITLSPFSGDFSTRGGLSGTFQGRVNGHSKAQVNGRLAPREGKLAVALSAPNAGAVFRAADVLEKVYGGALNLTLIPRAQEGTYDGALTVKNVRLREAPAMAALLNAISVVGLLEQLGGQGIAFAEVDARFRLTPEQVILTRSSATGPSMGISLDGYYNLRTKKMDLQGVLSPIYLINGIGSLFTRKGEGLIGFNFKLKGSASKPKVKVNPLSALTPGMFREIFRRPPPKLKN